jgi:2-polyprenyl-3-methyl-5-hydroxy-6-metoxy-1,4-benzoquinol methylase
VIARRELPAEHQAWNRKWSAPYGRHVTVNNKLGSRIPRQLHPFLWGPFGFQGDNNRTRRAEYPWAFFATPLDPGMTAVDIGGSLGGFQFALARQGLKVINVDPGEAASRGWPVDPATIATLNKRFKTDIEIRKAFLHEAGIADASVDRVFCISTIEHIPQSELPQLMAEVGRILRPGGRAVLTVDLFFDLAPFTSRKENVHGTNVEVSSLVEWSGLELEVGDRRELNGFPEFDKEFVQSELDNLLWGDVGPCVAQCFVLRKPS